MPDLNIASTTYSIIKIAAIFGLMVYNVLAFVIIRQVNLMADTLEIELESVIKAAAIIHFICAILVLLYAVFI
jgi:hypothetical protein